MSKVMTKEGIVTLLLKSELLSSEQAKEFELKADLRRVRLTRIREAGRRGHKISKHLDEISLVELLASFHFEIPGSPGSVLTEEQIMEALAKTSGLSYLKIDPLKLDGSIVTGLVPRPFALKHAVLPISLKDEILTIATADPFDQEVFEQLRRSTGYRVEVVVSSRSDIQKIITEFHGFRSSVTAAEKELQPQIDLGNLEQYVKLKSVTELEATDKHVVKAVEYMLQYAYDQRASDIHIEPKRNHSLVRFRIDGILHDVNRMPKVVHAAVVARIKTLSRMDIAEKRRPQDGRIKTQHKDREIELRVSTLPVAFGEKVVIRIFDPDVLMQPFEALGFLSREYELFQSFLQKPHGLILVTGPTGSGKTTTLYSALKSLATEEINITTIEDPIEMVYEGFNQVGIQPQAGVTFASSIRTILRQDPDVIMVGEIRDLETAENAIQAALTGHLVLSTLHTNDAPSAITRLLDLGVPAFLITATLVGVVAQRLMRKICGHCPESSRMTFQEAQALGLHWNAEAHNPIKYGRGCSQCRGTGYLGRAGIYEILNVDDRIRAVIAEGGSPDTIRTLAKQDGMTTLRECAIKKMLQGITTFQEVLWTTGSD